MDAITKFNYEGLGAISVATLAFLNGLFLLRNHLTDRPKLKVSRVHTDGFAWWVRLKDREINGQLTKTYAFIAYIAVANSGRRPASFIETRLKIRTRHLIKSFESPLYNIPEPSIELSPNVFKHYPVLQQNTEHFSTSGPIQPGASTAGITCFIFSFWGNEWWSPNIKNSSVIGKIRIKDVFGNKHKTKIRFSNVSISEIQKFIPSIEETSFHRDIFE